MAYGNFPSSNAGTASDVPVLAPLIVRAKAIIDEYTGRTFEYNTDAGGSSDGSVRYFDTFHDIGHDGVTLFLDDDIGGSILSVKAGSDTVASSNYTTWPRTDKPIYAIRLKDNSTNSWDIETSDGDWENAIVVTAEWCYSTAAPADITHACTRLTYYLYKQRQTDADLDRPLLTNDGVTIMPTQIPADVKQILNRYRRARVG
jgi:hypothetical protein